MNNQPRISKIPKIQQNLLSDELYKKCMEQAERNPGGNATQWIHLADAVSRGTISPIEAYDAISYGAVPEILKTRASNYYHLL